MQRKIKIVNLLSRNFKLFIETSNAGGHYWYVRNLTTCADTVMYHSIDDYRKIKRTWRKSKESFDDMCRMLEFKDLFSTAGVKL